MTEDNMANSGSDAPSDDNDTTRRALLMATGATATAVTAGCISTPIDLASTPAAEQLSHVVDSAWLEDNLSDVKPLDTRDQSAFQAQRVRGASRIEFESVSAQQEESDGIEPDVAEITTALSDAGVDQNDDVVVYGDGVDERVTRTAYALHVAGHDGEVYVLDGGIDSWHGYSQAGPHDPEPSSYDPDPNTDLFVTRTWLEDHLDDLAEEEAEIDLIDVRDEDAYLGLDNDDRFDRHGHLPGAINIYWDSNASGGALHEPDDINTLYFEDAGLSPGRTVVVYCVSGEFASNTWFTLRSLGFEDVRIYEGGWSEWGNLPGDDYPLETQARAVLEIEAGEDGADTDAFSC